MDIALQNAAARKAAAQQRIADIQRDMEALRDALGRAVAELDATEAFTTAWYDMAGIPNPSRIEQIEVEEAPVRRPKNPDRDYVVSVCLQLIQEAKRPLSRRELFQSLSERGIVINGKDPEMVLSTMLWRSQERIVRLPNHGYWPKQETFADAAYYPTVVGDIFEMAAKEPEDGVEADDAD